MKEILKIKQPCKRGYIVLEVPGIVDIAYPNSKNRRGRVQGGGKICPALATTSTPVYVEKAHETDSGNEGSR